MGAIDFLCWKDCAAVLLSLRNFKVAVKDFELLLAHCQVFANFSKGLEIEEAHLGPLVTQ